MLKLLCATCDSVPQAQCNYNQYTENVIRAIAYFIKGVDERNENLLNALADPKQSGLFDVNVEAEYKSNGFDVSQTGPFCNHQ